jgi:hypothetical protein
MALPIPNYACREIPGFPWLLWDILRAGRRRPEDTLSRQRARLCRLIEYARSRSPYYRERYAALPEGAHDLPALPPVAKSDLMANFDGWATDPAVTRETTEAFVADPARIGHYYLDRHVAFSTSGTTGTPVSCRTAGDVRLPGLLLARRLPTLIAAGAFRPSEKPGTDGDDHHHRGHLPARSLKPSSGPATRGWPAATARSP